MIHLFADDCFFSLLAVQCELSNQFHYEFYLLVDFYKKVKQYAFSKFSMHAENYRKTGGPYRIKIN